MPLLGLFLSSCENFFSTTITLDPPPFDKMIILDLYEDRTSTSANLNVTTNFGILDSERSLEEYYINDADVFFTVNGQLQEVQRNMNEIINYTISFDRALDAEDKCVLEVVHPDYSTAKAELSILPKSNITEIVFEENGGLDFDGNERSKITIKLLDKPGKNFYMVQVLAPDFAGGINETYISSIDPVVSESYRYYTLLISDESFDGLQKNIEVQLYRQSRDEALENVKVRWYDISESFYKYSRALKAQYDNYDNPFATPIQVPSNVQNGAGMVEIVTSHLYDVQ